MVDALFLDDGRKQDFGTGSSPVLTTNKQRGGAEVACEAHNLEVSGSNPLPATK